MAFLHAVSSGHSATKNVLKGRSLTPYLLLAPGLIWLITFFIIPIFSLASTSTMVRPDGAQVGVYEQKLRFANYVDAFVANQDQYLRSFFYAALATLLALAIVERRWAIAITVRPTASFSSESCINLSDTESRAEVASSKIKS